MKDFVNVGLLGAGTVGGGVLKVLEKNAEKIAKEVGKPVRITKVLDRHVDRLKQEYGDKYIFTDNADEVLEDKDIDIIVELLGREHPAKEFIARAFANGKHVVTANKDVLAKFGSELFPLAHEHNCDFMFEASVCGGIPIIGPLKTSMAANQITSIMGIVNGTTNYMLSKMANEHLDYDEVLKEAQAIGAASLVLCPLNDGTAVAPQETLAAMRDLAPLFTQYGIQGLVEPLGFPQSSLRSAAQAQALIRDAQVPFKLLIDTFHHHLYPQAEAEFSQIDVTQIGLVHLSGVDDTRPREQLTDDERIMLTPQDRLLTCQQVRHLEARGYRGDYAFEPFSPQLASWREEDIRREIEQSIALIQRHCAQD